jgi:mannose-6-phosphate isomerase-like protein (cupin superfamily)
MRSLTEDGLSRADVARELGVTRQAIQKMLSASGNMGDDQTMTEQPVILDDALSTFDQLWSPRIVTRVNDYDVRVAKVEGEHIWHTHDDTDEFFLVLDGELNISLREPAGERTVTLPRGAVFTVPRGTSHKPNAPAGARILMFEPSGTSTVGTHSGEVPDDVDATTGHQLAP